MQHRTTFVQHHGNEHGTNEAEQQPQAIGHRPATHPMSLLVTCPNCGPREIHELRCAGESTSRPKQPPSVRELNEYIYFRKGEWGVQREWWFCRSCEDWFLAERHTYTNEVQRTWRPEAPA